MNCSDRETKLLILFLNGNFQSRSGSYRLDQNRAVAQAVAHDRYIIDDVFEVPLKVTSKWPRERSMPSSAHQLGFANNVISSSTGKASLYPIRNGPKTHLPSVPGAKMKDLLPEVSLITLGDESMPRCNRRAYSFENHTIRTK